MHTVFNTEGTCFIWISLQDRLEQGSRMPAQPFKQFTNMVRGEQQEESLIDEMKHDVSDKHLSCACCCCWWCCCCFWLFLLLLL